MSINSGRLSAASDSAFPRHIISPRPAVLSYPPRGVALHFSRRQLAVFLAGALMATGDSWQRDVFVIVLTLLRNSGPLSVCIRGPGCGLVLLVSGVSKNSGCLCHGCFLRGGWLNFALCARVRACVRYSTRIPE